jgi:hypothetical protein
MLKIEPERIWEDNNKYKKVKKRMKKELNIPTILIAE